MRVTHEMVRRISGFLALISMQPAGMKLKNVSLDNPKQLADDVNALLDENAELRRACHTREGMEAMIAANWPDVELLQKTELARRESCVVSTRSAALEEAASYFDGALAYNWVAADGYANALDIAAELRFMASQPAPEPADEREDPCHRDYVGELDLPAPKARDDSALLQLALDALEHHGQMTRPLFRTIEAMEAIRERLALAPKAQLDPDGNLAGPDFEDGPEFEGWEQRSGQPKSGEPSVDEMLFYLINHGCTVTYKPDKRRIVTVKNGNLTQELASGTGPDVLKKACATIQDWESEKLGGSDNG